MACFHWETNVSEHLDSRRGRLQGSSTLSKNLPALHYSQKSMWRAPDARSIQRGRPEGERTEAHRSQCASTVKIAEFQTCYSNVERLLLCGWTSCGVLDSLQATRGNGPMVAVHSVVGSILARQAVKNKPRDLISRAGSAADSSQLESSSAEAHREGVHMETAGVGTIWLH